MRIVPFPSEPPLPGQDAFIAELEAALAGELHGPDGDAWRELREDVRALAQPIDPAFQARLEQELRRRGALPASPGVAEAPARHAPRPRRARRGLRLPGGLRNAVPRSFADHRLATFGGLIAAAVVIALAVVLAGPFGSRTQQGIELPAQRPASVGPSRSTPAIASPSKAAVERSAASSTGASSGGAASAASAAAPATAQSSAPASPGAASAPGRVQQLAASITLATTSAEVQAISDQVSELAVRAGGYVQSSNVRVQQQGSSEATLSLRIPSAKLAGALSAIGRLAPVRAENQSLEDITGSYEAAHRQLADTLAERSALLRALAAATSEGEIDSLRERLAANRTAIAHAQAAVDSVSQRASTAEVEVSVLASQHADGEGLTLHRGLHDAGRVLVVALVVALIACAALAPLTLLLVALAGVRSTWRRHQRERALGA
jgi:Domain of unknown function (DUF4349)